MTRIFRMLALSFSSALGQTVFTTDFNTTLPSEISPGTAVLTSVQGFAALGPAGNQFDGTFLRSRTANIVRLQLNELPTHTTVNIGFLLAAIDSLDGEGSYPSGDYFHIKLDGVTVFRESLANAVASQIQTYIPAPGAQLARRQDLGFTGPGSYYTDSAYNFAVEPRLQFIPHTASSLTLEYVIEGVGVQDLSDESWAIDNLKVEVTNGAASQALRLTSYKVTYPVGNIPRFSGLVHGAAPFATAILQASTDLGISDLWQNLANLPVNVNGSTSFIDIPDPSAAGAPRNFYRVKIDAP